MKGELCGKDEKLIKNRKLKMQKESININGKLELYLKKA